ncbi:MAG: cold shock domain-containing protein [Gammaproteobacteria bacterium]|nr:cold shock domain-containing protein [Gammaproteobacteria bacterium]
MAGTRGYGFIQRNDRIDALSHCSEIVSESSNTLVKDC